MANNSPSIILVMRIAASEAAAAGADVIEPIHLLVGLTKFLDLPFDTLPIEQGAALRPILEADAKELRTLTTTARLDAAALRRGLRAILRDESRTLAAHAELHRSPEARGVFVRAEEVASPDGQELRPVHLLAVILAMESGPVASTIRQTSRRKTR